MCFVSLNFGLYFYTQGDLFTLYRVYVTFLWKYSLRAAGLSFWILFSSYLVYCPRWSKEFFKVDSCSLFYFCFLLSYLMWCFSLFELTYLLYNCSFVLFCILCVKILMILLELFLCVVGEHWELVNFLICETCVGELLQHLCCWKYSDVFDKAA